MSRFTNMLAAAALLGLLGLCSCNKPASQETGAQTGTIPASASAGQSVELQVIGMHCDNCVQSIQGTVAKMDGVSAVTADFETGVVHASFDPGKVSEGQIAAEIESLGFTVPGRVGSPEAEAALAQKAAQDQAGSAGAAAGTETDATADENEGSPDQASGSPGSDG